MHKYALIRHQLQQHPLFTACKFTPAPLAKRTELELAHSTRYVTSFVKGSLSGWEVREIGFPWSLAGVQRALGSTGGTVAAVRHVMEGEDVLAGHLAGGTHHAKRNGGGGFCVFNDLAVGCMVARREFGVRRVCVVDLDVHQGDGTAEILGNVEGVETVSVHCEANYPFDKVAGGVDVGLEEQVRDERYLDVVGGVLDKLGGGWELVLLQMGVDGLEADRLGRWSLSREGLRKRNQLVYQWALATGGKTVVTMGGGYAEPIEESVQAHCDVYVDAVDAVAVSQGIKSWA